MTYDFRDRLAGDVIPFGGKHVKNPHVIKIHGEKYFLSDDGGPLGTAEEQAEWAGDARIIMGPGAGKFKYLWVHDTDRQLVVMWRAHDGNEKLSDRASGMTHKLVQLGKKSQLNRVDHGTFVVIERAMAEAARENEDALRQYISEIESDFQKSVNELTQQYFDQYVRPDVERAISAVQSGAVPLGFKPFGNPEDRERQMTTKVISDVMARNFSEKLVEQYVRDQGVDLDAPNADNQAVQWAVGDVHDAVYREYLPDRA
jgi:hypothetical protein